MFFRKQMFSNIELEILEFCNFPKDAQQHFMQNALRNAPRSLIWSRLVPENIFWKCPHRRSRDTTTTLNFLSRPDPYPNARKDEITPCGETPHSDIYIYMYIYIWRCAIRHSRSVMRNTPKTNYKKLLCQTAQNSNVQTRKQAQDKHNKTEHTT